MRDMRRDSAGWNSASDWTYRGASLTIQRTPLGPYLRPMPGVLDGSWGVGAFLWARFPCTSSANFWLQTETMYGSQVGAERRLRTVAVERLLHQKDSQGQMLAVACRQMSSNHLEWLNIRSGAVPWFSIYEEPHCRIVKRFRERLKSEARRLSYHSTLGSRVMKHVNEKVTGQLDKADPGSALLEDAKPPIP